MPAAAASTAAQDDELPFGLSDPYDEGDPEDEIDDDVLFGKNSSSRKQGSPKARLQAVFNTKNTREVYSFFGIILPEAFEGQPNLLQTATELASDLKKYLLSQPDKTINTYFKIQEVLLDELRVRYQSGQARQVPNQADQRAIIPEALFEMNGEVMVQFCKGLMEANSISATRINSGTDAAATAANPFNQDDYQVGVEVQILADLDEDVDDPLQGPECQPMLVLATARVTGLTGTTIVGDKAFEVNNVVVIRGEAFEQQTAWIDDQEHGIVANETTLQAALEAAGTLVVPVNNLRAANAHRDGPQHAGAAGATDRLTKTVVDKMKLVRLKLQCDELGLKVKGRAKAPYQQALHDWIDQHAAKTDNGADGVQAPQPVIKISRYTLKNWLNAATHLQQSQHMLLGDPVVVTIRQNPRMKRWLQMFKRATTMAQRRSLNDRQAGTLPTRPGEPQYLAMSANWFSDGTYDGLKHRAMFLEQMATAMRGSEVRGIELADRFIYTYDRVRPMIAVAVGSLKMNGKTNQNGQLMYYCQLRHKDPRVCPVAADGMFQMFRFGVKGEAFPDFTRDPAEWYFEPVYPSAQGGKMDYEEHRRNARAGLDAIDCSTSKSTHLPRQAGADRVIAAGGTREQAMVHCHWARQDVDLSYLNAPDINTLLLVAGFSGLDKHHIAWSILPPPQYCLDRLFVTRKGETIQQQIDILVKRNRNKETKCVTALNAAQYTLEIGKAALQALPMLLADGSFGRNHPLLQHPAINNKEFYAYAHMQQSYTKQLQNMLQAMDAPTWGPVLTQASPLGNITAALNSQDERSNVMSGAVITYAATTAAAYTAAGTIDLSRGAYFMLVNEAERDLLLTCRRAGTLVQASAAAALGTSGKAASSAADAPPSAPAGFRADSEPGTATATTANVAEAADAAAATDMPSGNAESAAAVGAGEAVSSAPAEDTAVGSGGSAGTATATQEEATAATGNSQGPLNMRVQVPDGDLNAKLDLLVGMNMQLTGMVQQQTQQQQTTNQLLFQLPAKGSAGLSGLSTGQGSVQQQQRAAASQQPAQEAAASSMQQQAACSPGIVKSFSLTTAVFKTVPDLLHLFERGWPMQAGVALTYPPMAKPNWGGEVPKSQKLQWDLMQQGYLLIKSISQQHAISMKQAADIVEVWRSGCAAVILPSKNISSAPAGTDLQAGSILVPSKLTPPTPGKEISLNSLLQEARNLDCVKAQKNQKRSEAGKAGGHASKRRRKDAAVGQPT